MKMTVIPIVTGELRRISRGFVKGSKELEIREHVEINQTTALIRSARILRIFQVIEEVCCHSISSKKKKKIH